MQPIRNAFVLVLLASFAGWAAGRQAATPQVLALSARSASWVPDDAVSQSKDRRVLGKLGQALFECAIYARPDTDSRIYYTTKQYDYIVVKPAPEKVWRRVLLQNGDYGYIEADLIAELPYQVLAPKAAPGDVQGPASLARRAIDAIGTPYKAGGRSLKKGIDSGGFVQQVFRTHGIKLPADPSRQVELGRAVSRLEDLAPGDRLYFWSDRKNRVAAAGIYIGKGTFVAAWPGRAVASAYLGEKKYLDKLVAARR